MAYRFQVFTGPPSSGPAGLGDFPTADPTAGGDVHTVRDSSGGGTWNVWPGSGTPVKVEAGESISDGDDLATDGQGRAVTATSGDTVVAEALESASSGNEFWAVWK